MFSSYLRLYCIFSLIETLNDVALPALEADNRGIIVKRGDAPEREDGLAEPEPAQDLAKRDPVGTLFHIVPCVSNRSPCLKKHQKVGHKAYLPNYVFFANRLRSEYFQDIAYRFDYLRN